MRKINRRNFLKAAGVLSAAVAGSLLATAVVRTPAQELPPAICPPTTS